MIPNLIPRLDPTETCSQMLPRRSSYQETYDAFRWEIPPDYNIAVDVCDRACHRKGQARPDLPPGRDRRHHRGFISSAQKSEQPVGRGSQVPGHRKRGPPRHRAAAEPGSRAGPPGLRQAGSGGGSPVLSVRTRRPPIPAERQRRQGRVRECREPGKDHRHTKPVAVVEADCCRDPGAAPASFTASTSC